MIRASPPKRAFASRAAAILSVLVTGTACDIIVEPGTQTTLANRGSVFGSGASGMAPAAPAVRVGVGASLVVADADVFGGGTIIDAPEPAGFEAAPGILATGGSVRVLQGRIQGGPILVTVDVPSTDDSGAGILALSSSVEISGGTIVGGEYVAAADSVPSAVFPAAGVEVIDSTLRINGGLIEGGRIRRASPTSVFGGAPGVLADGSDVEMRGGSVSSISQISGRVRVLGGQLPFLGIAGSTSTCAEIRGGKVESVSVAAPGATLFIFGTNLILGTGLRQGAVLTERAITGMLEDGTPIDARLFAVDASRIMLRAPGGAGCP